jgi:hypothetical protein
MSWFTRAIEPPRPMECVSTIVASTSQWSMTGMNW